MDVSSRLESLLGITLPQDYREFIDEQGYLIFSNIGMEVYGYSLDFDIDKLPCVIAATRMSQEDYSLKKNEIVISNTGYEDFLVILDVETGDVYELNTSRLKNVLANSFSNWLSDLKKRNNSGTSC